MKIEYLSYLVEVARCRSISAAARRLRLQQASLSSIIRSLEKELGAEIFTRTPSGVQLTTAGEQILLHVENILDSHDQLRMVANSGNLLRKNISITCYPSACPIIGPFLCQRLRDAYPEAVLHVHEASSTKAISSLVQGTSNIAVGVTATLNLFKHQLEAKNNGVKLEVVYRDHYYVCVRDDSPFANRAEIHIDELTDQHMAFTFIQPQFQNTALANDFRKLEKYSVFSNIESVKRSIYQYGLAAILPMISLHNDIYAKTGKLVAIPLRGFPNELCNYIVYDERKNLSPVEEFMLDELRSFFKELSMERPASQLYGPLAEKL